MTFIQIFVFHLDLTVWKLLVLLHNSNFKSSPQLINWRGKRCSRTNTASKTLKLNTSSFRISNCGLEGSSGVWISEMKGRMCLCAESHSSLSLARNGGTSYPIVTKFKAVFGNVCSQCTYKGVIYQVWINDHFTHLTGTAF